MPRPRNAVEAYKLNVSIPGTVAAKLNLHLYSETEQRIPFGAHQRFLVARIKEFFDRGSLDLSHFFHDFPTGSLVYGPKDTIELLRRELERQ